MKKSISHYLVHKSKSLVEAKHQLNIVEQKVLDLSIAKVKPNEPELNQPYRITVAEYADLQGITIQFAERELYRAVRKLRETTVIKHNEKLGCLTGVGLIEKYEYYYRKEKGGVIDITFPEELSDDLLAQASYSEKRLGTIFKITGKWSYKLYELLNQWFTAGKCSYSYKEFREIMGVNPQSYTQSSGLLSRIIKPSLKEINEFTDISAEVDILFVSEPKSDGTRPSRIPIKIEFYNIKKQNIKNIGQVVKRKKKGRKVINKTPPLTDFTEEIYDRELQEQLTDIGIQHLHTYKEEGISANHWREALKIEGDEVLVHHLITAVRSIKNKSKKLEVKTNKKKETDKNKEINRRFAINTRETIKSPLRPDISDDRFFRIADELKETSKIIKYDLAPEEFIKEIDKCRRKIIRRTKSNGMIEGTRPRSKGDRRVL